MKTWYSFEIYFKRFGMRYDNKNMLTVILTVIAKFEILEQTFELKKLWHSSGNSGINQKHLINQFKFFAFTLFRPKFPNLKRSTHPYMTMSIDQARILNSNNYDIISAFRKRMSLCAHAHRCSFPSDEHTPLKFNSNTNHFYLPTILRYFY